MLKVIFAASLIGLLYVVGGLLAPKRRNEQEEEQKAREEARQAHLRELYPDRTESHK